MDAEQRGYAEAVGQRIREAREGLGLSRSQLATTAAMPERSISRYESGDNVPGGEVLVKLARALKVTTDHILGADPIEAAS